MIQNIPTDLLPVVLGEINKSHAEFVAKEQSVKEVFERRMHLINEVIQMMWLNNVAGHGWEETDVIWRLKQFADNVMYGSFDNVEPDWARVGRMVLI